MIEISKDSVLNHFTATEKRDFFDLILVQITEIEASLSLNTELDAKHMTSALHKIKGTFSYFLETDALDAIKSLETKAKNENFNEEDSQNTVNLMQLIRCEIGNYLSNLN
jgi:hypothetical protein